MTFNHLMLWLVTVSCLSVLIRACRAPTDSNRGWRWVAGITLGITFIAYEQVPQQAGWIGGSLWFVVLFLPLAGIRWVNELVYRDRYTTASRIARLLGWLHPMDGWQEYPDLLHAMAVAQRGDRPHALALLSRYQTSARSIGRLATLLHYRLQEEWGQVLAWMREQRLTKFSATNQIILLYYLRSLGETGDLNGLLQALEQYTSYLQRSGQTTVLQWGRLFALAFAGETERLRHALQHLRPPQATQEFWLATAEMAAGATASAEQRLVALQAIAPALLRTAIDRRLAHPLLNRRESLTPNACHILASIERHIQQEVRYARPFTFVSSSSYATYTLIALNLLMFGLQAKMGGIENLETLYRLGALSPTVVWQGEWWRLLTANFLHFGWLHLGMNMAGLFFLGGFVEAMLGQGRYLITYLGSGIGAMLVITVLAIALKAPTQLLVGASAAIMGLVGAIAAIMLDGWRREKAQLALRNLRFLLLVIGIQVIFDLTTPNVSFMGHSLGLVVGFVITLLLLRQRQLQRKTASLF